MQSKTHRGVRHLLVSAGVISLVLSVAAPAALADAAPKPDVKNEHADNKSSGTTRVLICHKGRVLEVDDDAGDLGGHAQHGDAPLGVVAEMSDDDIAKAIGGCIADLEADPHEDPDELVQLCRSGELVAVPRHEVGETEIVLVPSDSGEGLRCTADAIIEDETKVLVCHEGRVLEIEADAVDAHLGHGDVAPDVDAVKGAECGTKTIEDLIKIVEDPIKVIEDPIKIIETPIVETDTSIGNTPVRPVTTPPVTPAQPVTPVQPIPEAQPRPIVVISTDTVTKPTPVVLAAPAATPDRGNEVLGAVTTRTPTGVGAPDLGAHTAGTVTALAATGLGSTATLVVFGLVLLLAGFGMQVSARRRVRSADVIA